MSTNAVPSAPVLAAEGLIKRFGGFNAVDDVALSLQEGTIHALIGPNGAGKTTCFNLLTKFLTPDAGTIHYRGRDITGLAPEQIARLGIVRSFQISAVFLGLTALQNMRVALMRQHGDGLRFWRSRRTVDRLNGRAMELLAAVGLDHAADTTAALLPYGRKRALEIAMTLALEPDVMLLDEPMAGLGHEDVARISALIRQVAANRSVLMVEHNLSVVADLSDTITVLARGAVLARGDYQTVSRDPNVISAYMGSDSDEEAA
ncbi:MAG: ABC transporter ATP-binding protein [Reyranella sp.]|jgi:branched-chain amino acid transport system ATP-binding protein|uniref:ABC transporter ATP-binding protein n=1 Tax=Reyranella sp. TaxID=1929291 RepID=UPI001AC7827F|nr:ABC transporter ATP-binding protein [Reyranella sp.]MBN9536498.1 ABC transporter ATP-binding protein [Alphaproteobacteria bacterium]MBR2817544.1 ABC transporter ATP-binding protein [Reyranella sp.]